MFSKIWRSVWGSVLKISGWKIIGQLPENLKKYIIIVVPHTSNWDFVVGLVTKWKLGLKGRFLGKLSLFRPPFGFFFRWVGGIPVDRSGSHNMVVEVAEIARNEDEFILAIAPEGTRKKVDKWRTGFYYIAREAGIPIVMAAMDYGKREIRFSAPFNLTNDLDSDLTYMKFFFAEARGFSDL